jgi:hypothetical protein
MLNSRRDQLVSSSPSGFRPSARFETEHTCCTVRGRSGVTQECRPGHALVRHARAAIGTGHED